MKEEMSKEHFVAHKPGKSGVLQAHSNSPIERVMQKDNNAKTAQQGEMHMKGKGNSESNWKRGGESLTPRRA